MGDNINSKDFIIGTLVGGIVGATVALMFAPKSGRELRADINEGALQFKDRANEWKETAQVKGADWYEKGTELTKQAVDSTTQFTRDVVQKTDDLTKNVSAKLKKQDEALEEFQENVNEVVTAEQTEDKED